MYQLTILKCVFCSVHREFASVVYNSHSSLRIMWRETKMGMLIYFHTNEIKTLFAILFTPLYCRCLTDFQYLLFCFQSQIWVFLLFFSS